MEQYVILAGLLSVLTTGDNPLKQKPSLSFGVIDTTEGQVKLLDKNEISASQPNQRVCWRAFDLPIGSQAEVQEIFTSPARMTFSDTTAKTTVSNNGRKHTITTMKKSFINDNGPFVENCWRFDKTDPIGKYSLSVRVNNILFPAQEFILKK